jgi:hypothetical protein
MATERKLHFLHIKLESMADTESTNRQLSKLDELLNSGWNILQAVPLAGAAGMAAPNVMAMGSPAHAVRFAEWAALIVLERTEAA